MRGSWQATDGSGGLGTAVLVAVAAALAVRAAPAVVAAAGLVQFS